MDTIDTLTYKTSGEVDYISNQFRFIKFSW